MSSGWTLLVLAVAGVALIAAAILVPPGDVRYHDTEPPLLTNNVSEVAEATDDRIYRYENLSERAQTLYERTLRNGGEYAVPVGDGAPEFQYPEVTTDYRSPAGETLSRLRSVGSVAIVRPDGGQLAPADEPSGYEGIDRMRTATKTPSVGSGAYLPQVAALLVGFGLLVGSGYLFVRPRI